MGRVKARKVLEATFSEEGLRSLARQIHNYRAGIESANDRFVRRLAEEGFDIAQMSIQSSGHYDRDKPIGTLDIISDESGKVSSCRLVFSGEQVLFVEFGAGFYYNTKENPWSDTYGYGVGTYPGQTHANDPGGWSYHGNDDKWHHTRGTEATMPMYNASVDMRSKIIKIAKEVYQGVI